MLTVQYYKPQKNIFISAPKESSYPYTFVWHFLENLNFEMKNTFEYIKNVFQKCMVIYIDNWLRRFKILKF